MIEFAAKKELTASKEKAALALGSALHIEPAAARLLVLRGIETEQEAQRFLHPCADDLHDPFLFASIKSCIQRIDQALAQKQKITVYSDYDADGTTAASILYLYFRSQSADIHIYTPHRHKEGYGMNMEAVKKIAADGTRLLITVDCGITNIEEVKLANKLGLDVIITDHHECPEVLPPAAGIINPKQPGCAYPFRHLCGAGIAFKLVEAHAGRQTALSYIDLAALGTIADIVPLLGENRVIATLGLQKMQKDARPGIRMLAEAAGIPLKTIDSRSVSFGLAPRINAASRMDDAKLALKLLTAEKEEESAKGIAVTLCEHNKTRQQIEEKILKSAYQRIETINLREEWAVLLADDEWNTGVTGIVCSQLSEDLYRPVILFGAEGENYVGSARSTDEINIFEALNRFKELFVRFGGHAHAAGLTIKKENLPILREKLNEYLKSAYEESNIIKKTYYDLHIDLQDATKKLIGELNQFKPYGQDNPAPVFYVDGARVASHTFIGKIQKDHLRLTLEERETKCNAICFNHTKKYCYLSSDNEYTASFAINDFDKAVQMQIQNIRPKITRDILNAYSRYLKKDFLFSFIDEIKACAWDYRHSEDIAESLRKELGKSRFGTLILFNTQEGLKSAMQIRAVSDSVMQGRLGIPCAAGNATMPYNMLLGYTAPEKALFGRYSRIFLMGTFSLETEANISRYFDDSLQKAYITRAQRYFMDRTELLKHYQLINKALDKGTFSAEESFDKVCRVLSQSMEKVVFMANVFWELGLIDFFNRDKIQFKMNNAGEKKDLKDSSTYMSFLNIFNK